MANSIEPDLEMAETQHPEGGSRTCRSRNFKPATRARGGHQEADPEDEDDPIYTTWEQVKLKNASGHYNFERFESMQLLNLCLLQNDLRNLSREIFTVIGSSSKYPAERLHGKTERLRSLLKEYNEALIAVHEIMSYPKAPFKNIVGPYDTPSIGRVPLLMTDLRGELEPDGVRKIVERLIPKSLKDSDFLSIGPRKELKSGRWINIRHYTWARAEEHEKEGLKRIVDNAARLVVSIFGGASLLAPVIAMIFSGSRNMNLIISSVFILFFALVLSIGSKASNQEILAATAGKFSGKRDEGHLD
ncbi:hypothetical protein FGG08_006325 [Glutinoglossum americanum]|uniref:DUF6594 domain-containing protein n=1 Tax=Glutinoglossum americanum TaxID=1670608 RepID=A0A9P8HYJ5_9PEZI|nr:hypothetical protein FGG08_006325 [Glutinoglossum americanum]